MTKFYLSLSRYLTALLILVTTVAWSQSRTVTGKVVSADDNSGLPGVNVIEKGTSNGTVTDTDGNYSINVGANATLVYSFVGFASQEVPAGEQTSINITLQPDVTALSEVVVIGYGEIKRADATGSLASVKSSDFNRGLISSPEQLIQGKAAGVQITSASGEPGAGINIRIRGTSSVRAGNNPLFVVDGIPLSGDDVSPGGSDMGRGTSSSRNPLNFLNPSDIQSIDILKDASATAIYGSRGANGVVIITTKSGKGTKGQLEYSPTLSISRQARYYDLLDRNEYLAAHARLGNDPAVFDFGANTDWQRAISRTAVSNRHDLSYSNSLKSGSYRASLSYDKQNGIIKNSGMERLTARLNGDYSFLNDKLKLGAQLTLGRVNDKGAAITNNSGYEGDLVASSYMANPTWPAYADSQFPGDVENPLAWLKYYTDNTETDRSLINLNASYQIIKDLTFKVNVGFDKSESLREAAISPRLTINTASGVGRAAVQETETSSDLLEAFFNYTKEGFGPGSLSAVLGYSYQEFNNSGITRAGRGFQGDNMKRMIADLTSSSAAIEGAIDEAYQGYGYSSAGAGTFFLTTLEPDFATPDIAELPTTSVQQVVANTWDRTDELQSFFGRVNYSIQDKYLLTATVRADGSTKFGGNNKYGIFPSAAFAWRLSNESFTPDFFEDLKLRIGYGVTGNQEIPHNVHQRRQRWNDVTINDGGTPQKPGANNVAFAYPDLRWEQTSQLNVGLDFAFLQGKFSGTIDYYNKVTTDLLFRIDAAQPSPQDFYWRNLDAEVVNKGVELTLQYYAIDEENVGLTFNINAARNKNEVKNLIGDYNTGGINGQGLTGEYAQKIVSGQPLYTFYLRDFLGYRLDASQGLVGEAIYRESVDKRFYFGKSPLPKYNVGFSVNFRYKGWDLSTYLNGQFGQYLYNNTANAFFTMGSIKNGRNVTEATIYSGESGGNAPEVSTRFLEKGDFLRMQTLTLGYNFKFEESALKSLRLFANAQNLFVITKYSGIDPEINTNKAINDVPSAGIEYTAYPRARTLSLGLNVTF